MRTRSWYKRGVAAVAAGLLAVGVAACDTDGGGSDSSTIEWWHIQPPDDNLYVNAWLPFLEEWNAANPDGPQVNETFRENQVFKEAHRVAMATNEPPDMFQCWGGGLLAQWAQQGLVRPLPDEMDDVISMYSPAALAPYTHDGRVYGLPWTSGLVGIWYNTELFAQAGLDRPADNWPDFLDQVQALKAAGITPIALAGQEQWPGHFWWSYLATRQAGLDALRAAGENRSFDNPDFVTAGELLQQLVELEPFQPGFLATPYAGDPDSQAGYIGLEEAAMELMGQWALGAQIGAAGLDEGAEPGEVTEAEAAHRAKMAFAPFPGVPGGKGALDEIFGGGDGICIGRDAPDETFDFLRYIFGDNYPRLVEIDQGGHPTRMDMVGNVDDPHVTAVLQLRDSASGHQLYLDQDFPDPVGPQVNESVAGLFAGASTPEQVVAEIDQAWANVPQ